MRNARENPSGLSRQSLIKQLAFATLPVVISACGGSGPPRGPKQDLGTTSEAVCQPSEIVVPNTDTMVCPHAWEFNRRQGEVGEDQFCCQNPGSCRDDEWRCYNYAFGVDTSRPRRNTGPSPLQPPWEWPDDWHYGQCCSCPEDPDGSCPCNPDPDTGQCTCSVQNCRIFHPCTDVVFGHVQAGEVPAQIIPPATRPYVTFPRGRGLGDPFNDVEQFLRPPTPEFPFGVPWCRMNGASFPAPAWGQGAACVSSPDDLEGQRHAPSCSHPTPNPEMDNPTTRHPYYSGRNIRKIDLINGQGAWFYRDENPHPDDPANRSPRCTVCDEYPFNPSSQAEVRAKYNCLRRSWLNVDFIYPADQQANRDALRVDLAKRLKLLYALAGPQLLLGDLQWIQSTVYTQYDAHYDCQDGFTPPASACSEVAPADNRLLALCRDIATDQSPDFVGTGVPSQCILEGLGNTMRGLRPDYVNVARNKPATQSSTYLGAEAPRANDGDRYGVFSRGSVTHTNQDTNPWWQVDLTSTQPTIDFIEVYNRTDAARERLSNGYVFVSTAPFASTDLAATLSQPGVWNYHFEGQAPTRQVIPVGQPGRYIRVQLDTRPSGTQYLSLAEVEVWVRRPTPCDAQPYKDAYISMTKNFLRRVFKRLTPDANFIFPADDLNLALSHSSNWYGLQKANVYPDAPPDPKLFNDLNEVLSAFWAQVGQKSYVNAQGNPAFTGPVVGTVEPYSPGWDVYNRGLSMQRQVLSTVLAIPVEGAPLVSLLGHGLRGVDERLNDTESLHEVTCQFRPCAQRQLTTEVSELRAILGAIPKETDLGDRIAEATNLQSRHPEWRTIFSNLKTQHAFLRNAILDASGAEYGAPPNEYDPNLILSPAQLDPNSSLGQLNPLSPPAELFTKLVQTSAQKADSYLKSGHFDVRVGKYINIGMRQDQITQVDAHVAAASNVLGDAVTAYNTAKLAYINSLVQQLRGLAERDNLLNKTRINLTKYENLSKEADQLRRYSAQEEARLGNFMRAFALQTSEEIESYVITRHPPYTVSVSAPDARFHCDDTSCPRVNDVREYAVTARGQLQVPLQVKKGDVLRFNITGNWSTTCALRNSKYTKPCSSSEEWCRNRGIPPEGVHPPDRPIGGPEGWSLNRTETSYSAVAHQTTESGVSPSALGCAGAAILGLFATVLTGGTAAPVAGAAVAATCAAIGAAPFPHDSSSHSDGHETRTTVTFANAIFAPDVVPFVTAPAGSLVLIQSPQGQRPGDFYQLNQIVEINVLQRNSAVVMQKDADVYLAVNDCNDGQSPADALTVEIQQLETLGPYIQAMGRGMAIVLDELRTFTDSFAEIGVVTPQEITNLRNQAINDMNCLLGGSSACRARIAGDVQDMAQLRTQRGLPPIAYTSMPAQYQHLFDTYLDSYLARFARHVEIRNIEKQMDLLKIEAEGLRDGIASQGQIISYEQLLTTLALENADAEYGTLDESGRPKGIHIKLKNLMFETNRWLFPIIDIRCPAAIGQMDSAILNGLAQIDWTRTLEYQSAKARQAVSHMLQAFHTACPFTDVDLRLVALGWVKPGTTQSAGQWPRVDPLRADKVWREIDAIQQGQTTTLSLDVQYTDLYVQGGTHAFPLWCTEASPVIKSAGLYVEVERAIETYYAYWDTDQHWEIGMTVDPNLTYATEVGLKKRVLEDPLGWSNGITLLAGRFGDPVYGPLPLFDRPVVRRSYGGNGLPIGIKLTLDTRTDITPTYPHPVLHANAKELVLLLELEAKPNTFVDLPPNCVAP